MSFWESRFGAVVGVCLLAWVLVVALAGVRVHQVTHPPRPTSEGIDFESMLLRVDETRFPAVDGVALSGWMMEGDNDKPPILLCHDLGESKVSLAPLAIELNGRGYPILLFDFRGHGGSDGGHTTLGVTEKRDVLGALDYLGDRMGRDPGKVGIYAVGMGAHAAVLAAADRPAIRVLVLDALYPDASYPLARGVFAGWQPGVRRLSFLSDGLFTLMCRTRIGQDRAADRLGGLLGRDLLLLAPEGDPDLMAEMQRMVASVPDQREVDGNLVVLPATQRDGLYGVHLDRHRERVARFFDERLGTVRMAVGAP